jgi:hypothetical protein
VGSISETLSERVHELLGRDRETILSTTGTRAAIESLSARTQALEDAVLELTEAIEGLVQSQHRAD